VSLDQLTENLFGDALRTSLGALRPELTVCATILALLLVRMVAPGWRTSAFYVMVVGSGAALYFALSGDGPHRPTEVFTGLLVYDGFTVYMRALLLLFVLLFVVFTRLSATPDRDSAGEFYVLILGATLGMCLMVSANHMLIVFLGIEMASVPSYALAGFLKHRRQSGEASLKYAVFGAGTAGVMLYGISLLVGTLGSAHVPTMAVQLADLLHHMPERGMLSGQAMVLVLAGLMLMVGLAFKLSAVPFHFWAPDVFEGATAEVAAFLSVASKAAALALLVRLAVGFGYLDPAQEMAVRERTALAAQATHAPGNAPSATPLADVSWSDAGDEAARPGLRGPREADQARPTQAAWRDVSQSPQGPSSASLAPARQYIAGLIALVAAVTCTFGNLAAYGQTNMKRLLAYSTIAHAGYMMMPVAAAVALIGAGGQGTMGAAAAIAAVAFYAGIYLFMNLGAFAAVAFLRNELQSEEIDDYAGLVRRSPGLTVCFAIILFSLVGVPPLAGFAAKWTIFAALFHGWEYTGLAWLLALLAIGALNTVLGLFYYLRVVRVMILAPEPETRPAAEIPLWCLAGLYCAVITVPLVVLGIWWNGLFDRAEAAAWPLLF
jgi:NADH-quinone oxidoreductase subunit N